MVRRPSDSSTFRSGFVDLGSGSPPSFWLRGGDSCVLAFVRKAVDISPTARESLRVSWLQVGGDCGGSKVFDEYEEQSDIAEKFRIKVVPLFHFYKNGELVESFPTRDKARILETIYKHLGVDQTIEEWSDIHGLK
ncbi:uncharacterized protein [Physcomitrium patens]|uniref:uncharacterized protein isoform X2 n=1 Tax=Physcomitrium patens TaxID=3218 RepID=UPI000D17309A|nr:uncharacterized protein LOC112288033 isoform X2 [Physcomitrium patens]|eukprot:XP_024387569.1 uncharacterized protein LOC112288033 isoform X2 [Physcomitrella patens]